MFVVIVGLAGSVDAGGQCCRFCCGALSKDSCCSVV
jgi:hypothetical protein